MQFLVADVVGQVPFVTPVPVSFNDNSKVLAMSFGRQLRDLLILVA